MTSESLHPVPAPARRTVVAAVGTAGLAVALTARRSAQEVLPTPPAPTPAPARARTTGSGGDNAAAGNAGGTVLAKTTDIPEGGGKVFGTRASGALVTQPTAGTYRAFSSKCTHQGCAVKGIANNVIDLPVPQQPVLRDRRQREEGARDAAAGRRPHHRGRGLDQARVTSRPWLRLNGAASRSRPARHRSP